MTEILELFAAPNVHEKPAPDSECPFCPQDDPEDFTTFYKGKDNDSSILGANMEHPEKLTSNKYSNVRPKDGNPKRQQESDPRRKPNPIWSCNDVVGGRVIGDYSCEPHHLIAGNQAMKGSPMTLWISSEKGKIVKDTGYSINNVENGEWFPSVPENSKVTKANKSDPNFNQWGPMDDDDKEVIAYKVMARNKGQFHKGTHNIAVEDEYHQTYKEEVRGYLKALSDLIHAWAGCCCLCEDVDPENGPFDPNWKVHDMLDRLSGSIAIDLKYMPSCTWTYFISAQAKNFHYKDCKHACLSP